MLSRSTNHNPQLARRAPLAKAAIAIALFSALLATLLYSPLGSAPLYGPGAGRSLIINDFSYHFANIVAWWRDGLGGYSPAAITAAIKAVLGLSPSEVMPNPLTPTIMVIWAPLLIPFAASLHAAYCSWLALSLTVLVLSVIHLMQVRSLSSRQQIVLLMTVVIFPRKN